MARMSLDDFFWIDGRIDLLARLMGKDRPYAENALLRTWSFCYKEKRYILTRKEIATQSTWGAKFVDWLLECELGRTQDYGGQRLDSDHVLLAGVRDRIEYLLRFQKAGEASAESRRSKSGSAQPRSKKLRTTPEQRSNDVRTTFDAEQDPNDVERRSEQDSERNPNDVRTSFEDCSDDVPNGPEPISISSSISISTSNSTPLYLPLSPDAQSSDESPCENDEPQDDTTVEVETKPKGRTHSVGRQAERDAKLADIAANNAANQIIFQLVASMKHVDGARSWADLGMDKSSVAFVKRRFSSGGIKEFWREYAAKQAGKHEISYLTLLRLDAKAFVQGEGSELVPTAKAQRAPPDEQGEALN